jgi:hypothetical protein
VSGASRTSGHRSSHRSNRSATQTDPNPKAGKSRVNIATLRKRFPMIVKSAFPGSITRGPTAVVSPVVPQVVPPLMLLSNPSEAVTA